MVLCVDSSGSTVSASLPSSEYPRVADLEQVAAVAVSEYFAGLAARGIRTPELQIVNFSDRSLAGNGGGTAGRLLAVYEQSQGTRLALDVVERCLSGPSAVVIVTDGEIEDHYAVYGFMDRSTTNIEVSSRIKNQSRSFVQQASL